MTNGLAWAGRLLGIAFLVGASGARAQPDLKAALGADFEKLDLFHG
jgi:hypothetical protein